MASRLVSKRLCDRVMSIPVASGLVFNTPHLVIPVASGMVVAPGQQNHVHPHGTWDGF